MNHWQRLALVWIPCTVAACGSGGSTDAALDAPTGDIVAADRPVVPADGDSGANPGPDGDVVSPPTDTPMLPDVPVDAFDVQPTCTADAALPAPLAGITVTTQTAAVLAGSGEMFPPMPLAALNAPEPAEANLTPLLHVSVPNAQCARMVHLVSPAIAIPTGGTIRSVEANFNGTALHLVDQAMSEITETPHSYGEQIPFFKPVFALDGVAPGMGTLVVNGFDAAHHMVSSQSIPNLEVVRTPPLVSPCQFNAAPHPRIWLTPARLANARARNMTTDPAARRFFSHTEGVDYFLDALTTNPDPTTTAFENAVYDPESYIPALGLCYQLARTTDTARAMRCANAGLRLSDRIANEYDTHVRMFGRDTGYDIRFGLMEMMLAYDWFYDRLTPAQKTLYVRVASAWIDWYHANGYAESHPYENYYAGWMQGLLLTTIATAGDNANTQRFVDLLNEKLYWEIPILNQRLCGGDWPEGWNYGPYSIQELTLFNQTLRDFGLDWGAEFDWAQAEARWMTYQMSPDFTVLESFGGYSGSVPDKTSPALLAVLSSTTTDGALAGRIYTNALAQNNNDLFDGTRGFTAFEMIFADTSTPGNVAALPLSYLASGTGRFVSRSSLTDAAAYHVTVENMDYWYDHYGYANGDVRLYHGATCLLCPSAYRNNPNEDFRGEDTTPAFSTYLVNGMEQDSGNRNNQVLFTLENTTWSAIGVRFDASYSHGQYDEQIVDPAVPLDYLIREVVHVRPGTIVVRDLHQRRTSVPMVANWHLGGLRSTLMMMGGGAYRVGTLNIETFASGSTPTTTFVDDTDAGPGTPPANVIGTVMRQTLAAGTMPVEMVTVFSETDRATSYSGGVVHLMSGQCVTFASGTVRVNGC